MDDATDRTPDNALPLPELVEARLVGDQKLTEPVKALIREALGDSGSAEDGTRTSAGPSTWARSPSPASVVSARRPGSS
ncbi:hypothetical protein ACFUIT_00925 [Streptomyces sp. NPDC057239]|uniref:hypothetical protein n=1 Tax=Streptomyces sp. NPDC057239 TaxID=3346061 RepID=UPI0036369B05